MADTPDVPTDPRFALPTTDLLDGYGVVQITLLHSDHRPFIADLDLAIGCKGSETISILDVCREVKRQRLAGTLPPVQVILFQTSYADANNPTPDLIWVYDRNALGSRNLVQIADRLDATYETWEIVPSDVSAP